MEVEENIRKVEYRSEKATWNTAWSARIKKKYMKWWLNVIEHPKRMLTHIQLSSRRIR